MEKKGEKPMGKIILVTGMLGNNSRGVPSFILNTAYMNAIVAANSSNFFLETQEVSERDKMESPSMYNAFRFICL